MTDFMTRCAEHFSGRENIFAWDCWNENRWRNMATEPVCFCEHSMASIRAFLAEKYGDLAGLGEAWGRRVTDWEDVRIGRAYGLSYPEMHDYTAWLCRRAQEMIRWRVAAIRVADDKHFISSHTGNPSIHGGVNINENIFSRGIDWDVAEADGYGVSIFPKIPDAEQSPVDFCLDVSACLTAPGENPLWISELQGGPTAEAGKMGWPIRGDEQQAWIWTAIARGCKGVNLWHWRPEVFGIECFRHGFLAPDGFLPDRMQAIQKTTSVIREHRETLAVYKPDPPAVGVLFQRDSYFYSWIATQHNPELGHHAVARTEAYVRALERLGVSYHIHDDRHLPDEPGALKLLIVPNPAGLDDAAVDWLVRFAEGGGTVFIEGAAGCQGADTFYRYPGDRPLLNRIGLGEAIQRRSMLPSRTIPAGAIDNDGAITLLLSEFEIHYDTACEGVVRLAPDDTPMLANVPVGKGRVVSLGAIVGDRMNRECPDNLDQLAQALLALADAEPTVRLTGDGTGFCTCRLGTSAAQPLLMITNLGGAQRVVATLPAAALPPGSNAADWFDHPLDIDASGESVTIALHMAENDHAAIAWPICADRAQLHLSGCRTDQSAKEAPK